jgi:hypothetical protein
VNHRYREPPSRCVCRAQAPLLPEDEVGSAILLPARTVRFPPSRTVSLCRNTSVMGISAAKHCVEQKSRLMQGALGN